MSFMPQQGVPGYSVPCQVQMPLVDGADAPIGTVYYYPGAKDDPYSNGQQAPPSPQCGYMQGQPQMYGQPGPPYSGDTVLVTTQPGAANTTIITRHNKPPSYLALSVVTCFCCSPLFGLIAIFFSVKSDRAYAAGDVEGARKYSTLALTVVILAIIITVLSLALVFTLTGIIH